MVKLPIKFHHPMFNSLAVIMFTNKQAENIPLTSQRYTGRELFKCCVKCVVIRLHLTTWLC